MPEPTITIRDLRIRVPGMGRVEARRLGEAVAQELANNPPTSATPRDLASLTVRMNGSAAQGTQQLATQIAASLRKGLR
jgi:hypothetical protein